MDTKSPSFPGKRLGSEKSIIDPTFEEAISSNPRYFFRLLTADAFTVQSVRARLDRDLASSL